MQSREGCRFRSPVSQIKAHLLTALCRECTGAGGPAEEAEARRLCDDINAMLDETAAWMFPAKVVLTPVKGIPPPMNTLVSLH
ncbi:MAG: hypothetical protein ACLR5S_03275 [Ruminococcus sp.]